MYILFSYRGAYSSLEEGIVAQTALMFAVTHDSHLQDCLYISWYPITVVLLYKLICVKEWQQSTLLAPSFKDEDEMTTGERTNRQGEECLSYPFTKCRGQATKSIAYRFPRTQRLPNRSETILMAG
ncbi:uncharacterized protein LOC112552720 isoform X1 [Pogonomyrmex barbatus]|uniref:Uncharacterized protein LOC112552720 isoform X1 n=1 Tax=Pogonomyrmex barbatus TaxID=144034 RepID=A0A8N1S8P3_9HYME|nr:uncharacterized protein LOC112552720 isoform X1 [Pogonomyrmex barbatus]